MKLFTKKIKKYCPMKLSNLLLLPLLSSCGIFIKKMDSAVVEKSVVFENREKIPTYCPINQKYELGMIGTNKSSQESYQRFTSSIKNISIIDHFIYWSLIQLSLRPDQSSPTARLQTLLTVDGKVYYFDFFSEKNDNQYPYLFGLEWILKKFNSPKNLDFYVHHLQSRFKEPLKVSKDLERFLTKNKELIKANKDLAPSYFRGTEVLKEAESTPAINLGKVLSEYKKVRNKQEIIINTTLHPFSTTKGQEGNCNYDFNLYSNSIFLIDKTLPVSNIFGIAQGRNAFLNSSSQSFIEAQPLFDEPLFKGTSKVRSSAICSIQNNDTKIWTISNESRDPGQHLFHLIKYGLPQATNVAEVDRLFKHSRHLFLADPIRLIIESNRSDRNQIQNLLKLNVPIYHAENLGNIWGYVQTKGESRFIKDERNPGEFFCK